MKNTRYVVNVHSNQTRNRRHNVVGQGSVTWVATLILDARDNNSSTIKESKLEEVKILFEGDIHTIIPKSTEGAEWYCEGWTCFYYYPFELGIRFPFPDFVEDLLRAVDVAPAQLMPSAWKILACLNAIKEKHHVGVNIGLVHHAFNTKKFNGCRYGFVFKKKDDPLILNLEIVNDRGWKNDYFFIEKSSLGQMIVSLNNVKQRSDESLTSYMKRYKQECEKVSSLDENQAMEFFYSGLDKTRRRKLLKSLFDFSPTSLNDMYTRAENIRRREESLGTGSLKKSDKPSKKDRSPERKKSPDCSKFTQTYPDSLRQS